LARTTLAVAGWMRTQLVVPRSVDDLLDLARRSVGGADAWAASFRVDDILHGATLLYALGEVELDHEDRLRRARS